MHEIELLSIERISEVYKTTKIHFFIPPPPSKIIFLSQLRHLVAAQWDTTFDGNCGIQRLVPIVGYNVWWQLWDINSQKKPRNE